jgi:hypothetical protein
MRIQETDRTLKEARAARRNARVPRPGLLKRLWLTITSFFK